MAKYYIRRHSDGKDIARTFTLIEAVYVAQSESVKEGGMYRDAILSITHNRKPVGYAQGYCIVRGINDAKYFITPESFVKSLEPKPERNDEFWGGVFAENGIYLNDN